MNIKLNELYPVRGFDKVTRVRVIGVHSVLDERDRLYVTCDVKFFDGRIVTLEAIELGCQTCDGTGRVHSHNDICWTCHGSGKLPGV